VSLASMACCCGSTACSLCCAACPSCKNSTSSRIMYAIILLLTMIVSCVLLAPGLQVRKADLLFKTSISQILIHVGKAEKCPILQRYEWKVRWTAGFKFIHF